MARVEIINTPIRKYPYKTRKGLSENQIKKGLRKEGWTVWRGGSINLIRRIDEQYPNVAKSYSKLKELLEDKYTEETVDKLCYLCDVSHGMPDFLCYHPFKGFKFVECKLGNEQLSARQLKAVMYLREELGFEVEVRKLVEDSTKTRKQILFIHPDKKWKKTVEKQSVLNGKF